MSLGDEVRATLGAESNLRLPRLTASCDRAMERAGRELELRRMRAIQGWDTCNGQNVRRWVRPQSLNGRAERLVSIVWAWIST